MPKGTTQRDPEILEQQQAAKGTGLRRAGLCFPFAASCRVGHVLQVLAQKQALMGIQGALDPGTAMVAIVEESITTSAFLSCS